MKFNNRKSEVLPTGRNNPMDQYTLGADFLENSSVEKDLGVLVDNELNVSQQSTIAAKVANSI